MLGQPFCRLITVKTLALGECFRYVLLWVVVYSKTSSKAPTKHLTSLITSHSHSHTVFKYYTVDTGISNHRLSPKTETMSEV